MSDAKYEVPEGYYYTKDHEWVKKISAGVALVGITDYAAKMLHDIVYVTLPSEGTALKMKDVFGQVESVKTVSDVFMPISGKVLRTNEALTRTPEIIANSPYGDGWMLELQTTDIDKEISGLLDTTGYRKFIEELKESES